MDPNNLKESKMDFTVMVNSIETDTPQRNEHLKTADFFDAEKYPNITFKSDKIVKKSKNKLLLYGKLTIKNVTKDVILPDGQ
ncbi:YceI family protein [Chryseobacterium indoltheticum]|uniref:YceI family protein n=1 Tax=Chryseobacterium indoltheticum TaxID=254 RepID=UPI003F492415